jgi:surface protein
VTDMNAMFHGASSFNADLSRWDVSSVTDMEGMFYGASSFNSDLSRWDVSSVIYMNAMFYGASSFNSDLSRWEMESVTARGKIDAMFTYATKYNATQAYKRLRAHVKVRAVALFWQEETAKSRFHSEFLPDGTASMDGAEAERLRGDFATGLMM